jgi:hypothetical protein
MTDGRLSPSAPVGRRRRSSSRIVTLKTTVAALIAATAITAGLAAQMAAGHDPALGAGKQAKGVPGDTRTQTQQPSSDVSSIPAPAPDPVVTQTS